RERHFPAAPEPDRSVPAAPEPAPGLGQSARPARGEAARDRRDPGGTREDQGRYAGLQEHRDAAREARRSRGLEERARGAQGDPHDPGEVPPEAGEGAHGALRGPRDQNPGSARDDTDAVGQRLNSLPVGVANPYIGTSIGEAVAEDSGSEDDDEGAEETAPPVGTAFAAFANVVLFPMFGFGGLLPVLTILLAGLLTTTIGSIIRDRYTNWVKMARTQKVMAAWRKEQMEAMRKGQQTRLSQLKEAQQGFMKDSMEVQTAPMKSMAWTMFMFIVIFTWLRLFVDVVLQDHGNQWIAVPWSNHLFLNSVYLFPSW